MMTANGIDVSNNNGKLDPSGFSGLDFLIAKATEGTGFTDRTYPFYQSRARALKLHFGAYHFLHAERLNADAEAIWFLRHANLAPGNSVWVDYETFGRSSAADMGQIALFAQTVKAHSSIKTVGMYSNLAGFKRVGLHRLGDVIDAFWLAEFNGQIETPDRPLNEYGLTWTLHQYEVLGGVDRDYSRISANALTRMFTYLDDLDQLA